MFQDVVNAFEHVIAQDMSPPEVDTAPGTVRGLRGSEEMVRDLTSRKTCERLELM